MGLRSHTVLPVTGCLLVALLAGPAPLATAGRPAEAAAAAALARVAQLTDQYRRAQAEVTIAVGGLAGAFTAGVQADRELDRRRRELGAARAERARTVRAIYTSGGPLALVASVLQAGTGEEALARATVSGRVLRGLAGYRARRVERLSLSVAEASASVAAADRAGAARAATLNAADGAADRADRALAEAGAILADLRARAAEESAQAEAARQAREADLAAARAAAERARAGALAAVGAAEIPDRYRSLYQAAAPTCPALRWTLLAAIGQVESGHGRNGGPSSAGAVGPMQFMPATFARYAVDGGGDGSLDPWDPADAIFTAARYLCASGYDGTPAGDQRALLAYNHAQWYVDLVLATERKIVEAGGA